MDSYKEMLKTVECPFNWKLDEIPDRLDAPNLIEKLNEKEEEVSEPWVHVCVHFNIAYLQFEHKKAIKAAQGLKDLDRLLNTSENELVKRYKTAFHQIYYACRAVLAMKTSTLSEVKEFAGQLTSDLSNAQLSAIYAIKANIFLEYGVNGTHRAMDYAKEALKLNPQEADWHFLAGKLYSRMRHYNREHMPSAAELSHLQTAYNITRSARAAIFLANAYLEKSKSLLFNARKEGTVRSIRPELNAIGAEAKRLIMYAIQKNDDQCVHITIRCAFGLSNLPFPERDVEKAKELLDNALDRSPLNPMGNKLAGDLCVREEKPMYDKALKYYKIAASKHVFSAEIAIFEINVKLGKTPDAEEFYLKLMDSYKEKNYQLQTLIHAAEYYMFIRRDLFMALSYFLKIIELEPNYHALTSRFVKYIKHEVNFYAVICNEARIAEKNNLYANEVQKNQLKKALSEISIHYPKIMEQPVEHNYIQKIIDNAVTEEKSQFNRGRGRGGRGRGGRGRGGISAYNERGYNMSRESNFSGNQRGCRTGSSDRRGGRGRNPSLERRGGRNSSQDRYRPRSRECSRERKGNISDENDLVEQLKQLQIRMNAAQSGKPMKPAPSYAKEKNSYGQKHEENVNNPMYIKYLEAKYKSKNHSQTFRDWLDACSNFHHSPPYSIADKDQGKNHESHKLMEEIKQKLSEMEIKMYSKHRDSHSDITDLSDAHASKNRARENSQSSRCKSPYRSSTMKQNRSSPGVRYSNSDDSISSSRSFSRHARSRHARRTSRSRYDQRSNSYSSSGRSASRGRCAKGSDRRTSYNRHRQSLSRSSSRDRKSKSRGHHSRDSFRRKSYEKSYGDAKRVSRVSSGERSEGKHRKESYKKASSHDEHFIRTHSRERSSSLDRGSKRRSRERSDRGRHYCRSSSGESSSEDYVKRDSRRRSSDKKSTRNEKSMKRSSSKDRRSKSRDCYDSSRRKSGSERSDRDRKHTSRVSSFHRDSNKKYDERKRATSSEKSHDKGVRKCGERYSDRGRHSSPSSRDSSIRDYSLKESEKKSAYRAISSNSLHRNVRTHDRMSSDQYERRSDKSLNSNRKTNRERSPSLSHSRDSKDSIDKRSEALFQKVSSHCDSRSLSREKDKVELEVVSLEETVKKQELGGKRSEEKEGDKLSRVNSCESFSSRSPGRRGCDRNRSREGKSRGRCETPSRKNACDRIRDQENRSVRDNSPIKSASRDRHRKISSRRSSYDKRSSQHGSRDRRSHSGDKYSRRESSYEKKSSRHRSRDRRRSHSRDRDSMRESSYERKSSRHRSPERRFHSKDRDFRRESSYERKSSRRRSLDRRSHSKNRDSRKESSYERKSSRRRSLDRRSHSKDRESSYERKSSRHRSPDRRRSHSKDRDSRKESSYERKSRRRRSLDRRSHSKDRESSYERKSSRHRSPDRRRSHSKDRDSRRERSYESKSSRHKSSDRRGSPSRDRDSRKESYYGRKYSGHDKKYKDRYGESSNEYSTREGYLSEDKRAGSRHSSPDSRSFSKGTNDKSLIKQSPVRYKQSRSHGSREGSISGDHNKPKPIDNMQRDQSRMSDPD